MNKKYIWFIGGGLVASALFFSQQTGFYVTLGKFLFIIGVGSLIGGIIMFFSKNNDPAKKIPPLSVNKEAHYLEAGLDKQEIIFFRQTMATAKENIQQLENNMRQSSKLRAIDLRYQTLTAAKGLFKELVKEPRKLHLADQFLYSHLPNIVELTTNYVEISQHELKNKATFDLLEKSIDVIEQASQLLVIDYQNFVSDDIEDLDINIQIAKKNIERELNKYTQKGENRDDNH